MSRLEELLVYKQLVTLVEKELFPHCALFSGRGSLEKNEAAYKIAKLLLKEDHPNPPDLLLLRVEGKAGIHTMASIRQAIDWLHYAPYQAKRKVLIIEDAESMHIEGANALLKTLEEPPPLNTILLVAEASEKMLPTILSRVRHFRFSHTAQNISEKPPLPEKVPFSSFSELLSFAKEIEKSLLIRQKKYQEEQEAAYKGKQFQYMSSQQKAAIEKEILGRSSLFYKSLLKGYISDIIAFFRDLYMTQYVSEEEFYLYRLSSVDYTVLDGLVKKDQKRSLELLHDVLEEANLAIDRSTSCQEVLKSLFLRLRMVE